MRVTRVKKDHLNFIVFRVSLNMKSPNYQAKIFKCNFLDISISQDHYECYVHPTKRSTYLKTVKYLDYFYINNKYDNLKNVYQEMLNDCS